MRLICTCFSAIKLPKSMFTAPNPSKSVPHETDNIPSVESARSMAIKPASMTTPESMALIPLGACECASGSQVCNGTSATFTPKPITKNAPAKASPLCVDVNAPVANRILSMSNVPVAPSTNATPNNTNTDPTALCTRYLMPASNEADCSR